MYVTCEINHIVLHKNLLGYPGVRYISLIMLIELFHSVFTHSYEKEITGYRFFIWLHLKFAF